MHVATFVRAVARGPGGLEPLCFVLLCWGLVACGHETLELYTSDPTAAQTGGDPGMSDPAPVADPADTPSEGPGGAMNSPDPPLEEATCCDASRVVCQPGALYCLYCAGADGCPLGLACDPLTNQCLAACTTHWMCPDYAPLCDDARGICVHCFGDLHCPPEHSCVQGFCLKCSGACP